MAENLELHIALLEPEIPPNTGNIARTCAGTGARLHLIEPLGFSVEDRYLRRAGLDYWSLLEVRVHPDFHAFLKEMRDIPLYYTTKKATRIYTELAYPPSCCFVFGKETVGLPQPLLDENPGACVRIPLRPEARSLNLSNAAAVMVFEFFRQHGFSGLEARAPGSTSAG